MGVHEAHQLGSQRTLILLSRHVVQPIEGFPQYTIFERRFLG